MHVWKPTRHRFPATSLTYLGNVMNTAARSFYQAHGVASVEPAYEKQAVPEAVLMFLTLIHICLAVVKMGVGARPFEVALAISQSFSEGHTLAVIIMGRL